MEQHSTTLYTGTLAKNVFTKDNEPGLLGLSYSFIPESVQDDGPAVITRTDSKKESYRVTHLPPSGDKAIAFDCDEANFDDSEFVLVVNHSTKTFTLERREFRVALTNRRWVPVDELEHSERVLLEGEDTDSIDGNISDDKRSPFQGTGATTSNIPNPVSSVLSDFVDGIPTTLAESDEAFATASTFDTTDFSRPDLNSETRSSNPTGPTLPERPESSLLLVLPGQRKILALPRGTRGGSPAPLSTPPSLPLTVSTGPDPALTNAMGDDDFETQLNRDKLLKATKPLDENTSASDSSDDEMELIEVDAQSFRSHQPDQEENFSLGGSPITARTPETLVPNASNEPISLRRFLGGEEDEENALTSSDEE